MLKNSELILEQNKMETNTLDSSNINEEFIDVLFSQPYFLQKLNKSIDEQYNTIYQVQSLMEKQKNCISQKTQRVQRDSMNSTNRSKFMQEVNLNNQILIQEIAELLQNHNEVTISKEIFECQQKILSKMNIEMEQFKQFYQKELKKLQDQVQDMSDKLLSASNGNQSGKSCKDLYSCSCKVLPGDISLISEQDKQILTNPKMKIVSENRRALAQQILEYSRIQNKRNSYVKQLQKAEIELSLDADLRSNTNILGNDMQFSQNTSILENRIHEVQEESNRYLKQVNRWYLKVLSRIDKVQAQAIENKICVLQKLQSNFSGVWNVITNIQQQIGKINVEKGSKKRLFI